MPRRRIGPRRNNPPLRARPPLPHAPIDAGEADPGSFGLAAGMLEPQTEDELAGLDVREGPLVAITAGTEGDLEAMAEARDELTLRGLSFEETVVSPTHDPDLVREWARGARQRGIKVVIAGASMSAALPGMIAAQTDLPVIGVPIMGENSVSGGLDALLSIAQAPPGNPVACVAVGGARNAAILAARIIFA